MSRIEKMKSNPDWFLKSRTAWHRRAIDKYEGKRNNFLTCIKVLPLEKIAAIGQNFRRAIFRCDCGCEKEMGVGNVFSDGFARSKSCGECGLTKRKRKANANP